MSVRALCSCAGCRHTRGSGSCHVLGPARRHKLASLGKSPAQPSAFPSHRFPPRPNFLVALGHHPPRSSLQITRAELFREADGQLLLHLSPSRHMGIQRWVKRGLLHPGVPPIPFPRVVGLLETPPADFSRRSGWGSVCSLRLKDIQTRIASAISPASTAECLLRSGYPLMYVSSLTSVPQVTKY